MNVEQWEAQFLRPIRRYVEDGERPSAEMLDGFAGFVLDGVLAVKDIDGAQVGDWDCVELVAELVDLARRCEADF